MVSEERIRTVFTELAEIDSESFGEKQIGENIVNRLRALGLEVTTSGGTRKEFREAHPGSHPNIYAALKGTVPGEPVLFSAHLDTVAPGIGKRAVTEKDGTIRTQEDPYRFSTPMTEEITRAFNSGICCSQTGCFLGQRVQKWQFFGRLIGLLTPPSSTMRDRVRSTFGSGSGIAESSASV